MSEAGDKTIRSLREFSEALEGKRKTIIGVKELAALREENERLNRGLHIALDALSKARRDIREHLQVAKWNLNGEVIPGETIDPPTTPNLIHQSGIDASERVIAEIEHAMKIGIGLIGVPSATSGESEGM